MKLQVTLREQWRSPSSTWVLKPSNSPARIWTSQVLESTTPTSFQFTTPKSDGSSPLTADLIKSRTRAICSQVLATTKLLSTLRWIHVLESQERSAQTRRTLSLRRLLHQALDHTTFQTLSVLCHSICVQKRTVLSSLPKKQLSEQG